VNGIHSAGQVYIFNAKTGSLLDTLVSSSPQDLGDFGRALDLADGLLAVGAPFESVNGVQAGRVHIFDIRTGSERLTLVSPNPEANGIFGAKIEMSGSHIIVGALGEGHLVGRAYIFSTSTGALITTLVSPNAPNEVLFGSSVALTNRLALVGSPSETVHGLEAAGSVYVFDVTTGSLIRTIADPNPQTGGRFGFSLKLAGNSLIIGAPNDMVSPTTLGRVYVFNAASGSLTATLVSPDTGIAGSPGLFGNSVDSANGRIYVGAPAQAVKGQLWTGGVYIFN
jgi:outer membrane protein assembly factor BamB